MSFNYEKHKNRGDDGSFWTSYSDLFLGMSVIFLLLYVTTSLRTGSDGIRQAIENKKLVQQVEDLKNQLKAYDSIRKDYLDNKASPDEEKVYSELMDKLTLLQEEAKDEKNKLRKQAKDNEDKERALNQYQQMVRNIINANVMAKNKIKKREDVIEEQDTELDTQTKEIATLKKDVQDKTVEIADVQDQLKEKLDELKVSLKKHKLSQAAYEKKAKALRSESEKQVAELRDEIQETQDAIKAKAAELEATRNALSQKENEARALAGANQKLGSALEQEKSENTALAGRNQELAGKAQALAGEVEKGNQRTKVLSGELDSAKKGQAALAGKLKDTEGELTKARAEADARKQIAKNIKDAFAKAGVKADVDGGTGEVVLNFGDVYFDNDSAKLKNQMKDILKKAMPAYSQSLLGNEKIASKISAVEIIGFASPTYKGKYVDPTNLDPGARKAVDYNLDLSYQRARSMFQYVFDEKAMKFGYQKELLPLIKVTGRSFLAEKGGRSPAGKGGEQQRAQKVIIRFNFEDKK